MIMSEKAWDTYCWQFNQMNGLPQDKALTARLQRYTRHEARDRQDEEAKAAKEVYDGSVRGKSMHFLWPYFTRFVLPCVLMLALWEDMANAESPRRGWWKQKLAMPDVNDYLMFEVGGVFSKQAAATDADKAKAAAGATDGAAEEERLAELEEPDDREPQWQTVSPEAFIAKRLAIAKGEDIDEEENADEMAAYWR